MKTYKIFTKIIDVTQANDQQEFSFSHQSTMRFDEQDGLKEIETFMQNIGTSFAKFYAPIIFGDLKKNSQSLQRDE